MKNKKTQAEANALIFEAVQEIQPEILKKLPQGTEWTLCHVYKGSNPRYAYKRHDETLAKQRDKGITFLFLPYQESLLVYTSVCSEEDTYHRLLGKQKVLSKLNKDVQSNEFKRFDFKVPLFTDMPLKSLMDACIYLRLNMYKVSKIAGLKLHSVSMSAVQEQLGGLPLFFKDFKCFVDQEGSIMERVNFLPHEVSEGHQFVIQHFESHLRSLLWSVQSQHIKEVYS